jgi:hypothetical protein
MGGTSFEVKLARFRRSKVICSPSCADYRPETHFTWVTHLGENMYRRKRERERNLKLESV